MLRVYPYRSRRRFETRGKAGGINADRTYLVKTEAVGKSQWLESPYLIANEWIAGQITQFLCLPVPPFAVVQKKSLATAMFTSYSFEGDSTPDDVDPQILYERFPFECTGIVLFDILIANCDRHGGNLKVDKPGAPRDFYLIDHERALFYIYKGEGIKRLKSREKRLGVTDGSESRDEWHCLVELLDSVDHITCWVKRVQDIPDWFIDEICDAMWKVSVSKQECAAVKEFLKRRRDSIGELIVANEKRFPGIKNWPLFLT